MGFSVAYASTKVEKMTGRNACVPAQPCRLSHFTHTTRLVDTRLLVANHWRHDDELLCCITHSAYCQGLGVCLHAVRLLAVICAVPSAGECIRCCMLNMRSRLSSKPQLHAELTTSELQGWLLGCTAKWTKAAWVSAVLLLRHSTGLNLLLGICGQKTISAAQDFVCLSPGVSCIGFAF